jgi:hypothetical protein
MMQPERDDTMEQPSTADLANTRTPTDRTDATTETTPEIFPDRPFATGDDATGAAGIGDGMADTDSRRPLLGDDELDGYRSRWQAVQVRFVDEPRDTVKEADALVAELMQRLAQTFAEERSNLETQWERGTDVSTEDLRVAMQRYRSFFDRLLAA